MINVEELNDDDIDQSVSDIEIVNHWRNDDSDIINDGKLMEEEPVTVISVMTDNDIDVDLMTQWWSVILCQWWWQQYWQSIIIGIVKPKPMAY